MKNGLTRRSCASEENTLATLGSFWALVCAGALLEDAEVLARGFLGVGVCFAEAWVLGFLGVCIFFTVGFPGVGFCFAGALVLGFIGRDPFSEEVPGAGGGRIVRRPTYTVSDAVAMGERG